MHLNIQLMLTGLGAGAAMAGLALGLIVIYRGSGVLNFAQGAIASVAAYVLNWAQLRGWPIGVAAASGILSSTLVGVLFQVLIMRRLRNAPALAKVVATLGLLVTILAALPMIFGLAELAPLRWVSQGTTTLPFGSPNFVLPTDRLIILAAATVMMVSLMAIYRFTTFGRLTRAAAENERALASLGYSPDNIALLNWAAGSFLAGVAGVLLATVVQQAPNAYTLVLIGALAASLVGRFRSFGITFVACLAIGALQALILRYDADLRDATNIIGWSELLPFAVIVVYMVASGKSIPIRGSMIETWLPTAPRARRPGRTAAIVLVLGALWFGFAPERFMDPTTVSLIGGIVCLSLVVLTGYLGQVSLVQMSLAGVGAFFASRAATELGVPFPLPVLIGAIATVPVGLLISIPALRVRGINLAVVTLGAALVLDLAFFGDNRLNAGAEFPPAKLGPIDMNGVTATRSYGFFVLVVAVIAACGVVWLRRSHLGVRFLAVRANERSARALGVSVGRSKAQAFSIAAFLAGLAGGLYGYRSLSLSYETFGAFHSIVLLATAYLGGIASVAGAFIAGSWIVGGIFSHILTFSGTALQIMQVIGGVGVMLTVVFHPDGMALFARDVRKLRQRKRVEREGSLAPDDTAEPAPSDAGASIRTEAAV